MKTTGMKIDDFIREHKHVGYLEGIMYPDGTIEYATPSHTMKLCEIYDDTKSIDDIGKMMSSVASPIAWLTYHTGCIALWTSTIILNERFQLVTDKQKESLIKLYENELITYNPEVFIDMSNTEYNIFQKRYEEADYFMKKQLSLDIVIQDI